MALSRAKHSRTQRNRLHCRLAEILSQLLLYQNKLSCRLTVYYQGCEVWRPIAGFHMRSSKFRTKELSMLLDLRFYLQEVVEYRKISPSKYKPTNRLNHPSRNKLPGGSHLENSPQIQSKTKQKQKFTSNYKSSPVGFARQISLPR